MPDKKTVVEQHFGPSCWETAGLVIPHTIRTLLYGPPGTGKTFAGINFRTKTSPFYVTTVTKDTPVAELRGHYIPAGGDKFVWHDGPAILAWRNGGRFVINEVDRASPEVTSFLYVILDDPESAFLTLPTGETVHPKEGFSCVGTMNGEPEDIPEALQDRFTISLNIDEIHPDAINNLPEDLRKIAVQSAMAKEPGRRVSIRKWMEFARLRACVGTPGAVDLTHEIVAHAVFGHRAKEFADALSIAGIADLLPADKRGAWGSTNL